MSAYSQIPNQLRDLPNWVVWKKEKRNGKFTKVPYDTKGGFAKSNDALTWCSFEAAEKAVDPFTGRDKFDGVGFMLHGTPFVGIDFDGCIDDGVPEPYVLNIITQLGNPYVEITPSGTGLRVFVECPKLPPGTRKVAAKKKGSEKYGAEIYSGAEGGRYLTLTGDRLQGDGIPKIDNLDIPYYLITRFSDDHFKKLWMGDATEYENDDSRVDLALLGCLARSFGADRDKMTRFFNASVPGHREKWIKREDYRNRTINTALSSLPAAAASPTTSKQLEFHLPAVTTGTHHDYVIAPAAGQHDGWFPLGDPSLVGGSSGANKTTFMIQLLLTQAAKAPFFGHQTLGRPYLVVMFDRGENAQKRTLERMGLSSVQEQIPIGYLSLAWGREAAQSIINEIEKQNPLPQVVFIEGLDMLVKDPNKMEVVAPFMRDLQEIARHFHVALIGSVGSAKSKMGQGYVAKRDQLLGSVAWARNCETVVLLQFPKGEDTAGGRELTVQPRNAPAEKFNLAFKDGNLEVQTENEVESEQDPSEQAQESREIRWVKKQARLAESDPSKRWFTVADIETALKVPHSTMSRWILNAHTKRYIVQKSVRKGARQNGAKEYQWNATETNPLWVAEPQQEEFAHVEAA